MVLFLRLVFRTLKMIVGTGVLAVLLCAPLEGLVSLISWKIVAAVALFVGAAAPALLFGLPGFAIPRLLRAQPPRSNGFRNSYELAYARAGVRRVSQPELLIYPDSTPNVLVIRGFGSHGAILFSEGLISVLDEAELRLVLIQAIRHLSSFEIALQSACVLALLVLGQGFSTDAKQLRAAQALRNLLFFPWVRFYTSLLRGIWLDPVQGDDTAAIRKVAGHLFRVERLYGQCAALPGLVYLGIQR
jgi:Zn-dependent protease with chaperone function